jgi:hypothetical protein
MTNLHKVNEITKMIKRYENAKTEWTRRVNARHNTFLRIHEVSKRIARNLGISNNDAFDNITGLTIHPAITGHNNYKKAANNYNKAHRNMKNMYRIAMLTRRNNIAKRLGLGNNPSENRLRQAINKWKRNAAMHEFAVQVHSLPVRTGSATGTIPNAIKRLIGEMYRR